MSGKAPGGDTMRNNKLALVLVCPLLLAANVAAAQLGRAKPYFCTTGVLNPASHSRVFYRSDVFQAADASTRISAAWAQYLDTKYPDAFGNARPRGFCRVISASANYTGLYRNEEASAAAAGFQVVRVDWQYTPDQAVMLSSARPSRPQAAAAASSPGQASAIDSSAAVIANGGAPARPQNQAGNPESARVADSPASPQTTQERPVRYICNGRGGDQFYVSDVFEVPQKYYANGSPASSPQFLVQVAWKRYLSETYRATGAGFCGGTVETYDSYVAKLRANDDPLTHAPYKIVRVNWKYTPDQAAPAAVAPAYRPSGDPRK
jgi:hypothetical protein